MRDPSEMVYMEMLDDFFWSQFNTGVAYGSVSSDNMWGFKVDGEPSGIYSIIDTGSSHTMLASSFFMDFTRKLFESAGD